jgi:hypothetical protein
VYNNEMMKSPFIHKGSFDLLQLSLAFSLRFSH